MLMYIGIVFTFVLGVLLHYIYDWSGRSLWVMFIAPTNASLFEHMKVLVSPYLLWTLVEYFHYGQFMHAFIPAKVISLYIGMAVMVVLCLLAEQITRTAPSHSARQSAPAVLSIRRKFLILAAAVIFAFFTGEFLMTLTFLDSSGLEIVFDGVLVLTVLLFAAFSIYPPNKGFFKSGRSARR